MTCPLPFLVQSALLPSHILVCTMAPALSLAKTSMQDVGAELEEMISTSKISNTVQQDMVLC